MRKGRPGGAGNVPHAASASRPMKSSKNTSPKRKRKSGRSGASSPKGRPPRKGSGKKTAPQKDADDRLRDFILGMTPLVLEGKDEHWHDMDAGRTYTLHEIATVMGVTRERVRQIEASAMRKVFRRISSIARSEGDNPIEWFRKVLKEIDDRGRGHEYDVK